MCLKSVAVRECATPQWQCDEVIIYICDLYCDRHKAMRLWQFHWLQGKHTKARYFKRAEQYIDLWNYNKVSEL